MLPPEKQLPSGLHPVPLLAGETEKPKSPPIGPTRPLTVFEEIDMLAAGKTREEVTGMTPEALENIADTIAGQSDLFIGS